MNPPGLRSRRGTVALVLVSLVCAGLALRPEPGGAAVVTAARPLWAPDRLPGLLAEAQGTVDLGRAVDELLGGSGARTCLAVYEGSRPVLLRRPDDRLTPASTQKLLVATAALATLGPDFRFETRVLADTKPRDGKVGTLWLVGAGDPTLATPEYAIWLTARPRYALRQFTPLAALADGLVAAGVRTVTGSVVGDDSRYDRTRTVPTWKPSYITDNEVGPLGALLVNDGFTVFDAPKEVRADDPAVHAAGELTRLAGEVGIAVGGPPVPGQAPAGAVPVATVRSAPLADLVANMLRESDNTAAELLTRELGVARARAGSTAAGTEAVVDDLTAAGFPTAGLRLGDGSGLEATNTATCTVLAAALRAPGPAGGPRLEPLLAVAGRSGTLALRLADTPLDGKLRAKTGSLDGVSGLAGYLDGRRALSFAFLANGRFTDAAGRLLQDRLTALLAAYPGPQPHL
ncbi:MAG TPA: D-alanyl-D-alanine carboxypeptidase/D-alanyl-D-alanine-endopeptidase [Acidimicrobiia bacterium]|nr:D-alanyl-D-alanine carboxypeptidase/D-alanyl-D-alanine-endopeptidase [Acidimicrobiia bacterium]